MTKLRIVSEPYKSTRKGNTCKLYPCNDGVHRTIRELADILHVNLITLRNRISSRGWSDEFVLTPKEDEPAPPSIVLAKLPYKERWGKTWRWMFDLEDGRTLNSAQMMKELGITNCTLSCRVKRALRDKDCSKVTIAKKVYRRINKREDPPDIPKEKMLELDEKYRPTDYDNKLLGTKKHKRVGIVDKRTSGALTMFVGSKGVSERLSTHLKTFNDKFKNEKHRKKIMVRVNG